MSRCKKCALFVPLDYGEYCEKCWLTLCECGPCNEKLKQINEIADVALKSKIVVELYPRNHGKTLARTRYDALLEIRGLSKQ